MDDVFRQKWHDLLRGWAVDSILAGQAFDDVVNRCSDPSRFYHTLDHVRAALETVESLAPSTRKLNAVKLAAWLHDVIYGNKAWDNEGRSAEYAERLCRELSIPQDGIIASVILRTKTHNA